MTRTTTIRATDWESDALLSDGALVHLRLPRHDDMAAARSFFDGISAESSYFRFFSAHRPSDEELARHALAEHDRTTGLLAEIDGRIVAVASYVETAKGGSAEVAFAVDDMHQHRGIGTLLLEHLAAIARTVGITRFTAATLANNKKMLNVFRSSGFETQRSLDAGVWELELTLDVDAAATELIADREHVAEARSVKGILSPETIAVIGASGEEGSVGHALFKNLLNGGFRGAVFPINPRARSVLGVRAYASVLDVPDTIDLAVIAVPAPVVPKVLDESGQAGAHAAVVVTAGFAESGVDGAGAEAELVRIARQHGMRLVGPNCIGIVNTDPDVRMDATFSPVDPVRGSVGFASQSGAMGIAALAEAHRLGIGISSFVSLGNKADVSGNDLLQYWESDPATTVAALYLESFGNPQKFGRIVRRFSRTKPLVVMKSGRTDAGRRAASSHTAAMSSDDALAQALFSEAGIIRIDTLAEFFDVTRLLVHQPLPKGRRVAIVGNSGGPGILAADACVAAGLTVPQLAQETQDALRAVLPSIAAVSNPVDLIAGARGDEYEAALRLVLADDAVDAMIVIYTDPMISKATDICAAVTAAVAAGDDKPVAAVFLAADVGPLIDIESSTGKRRSVPVYEFPEAAAVALGRAAWLGAWRARPPGTMATLDGIDTRAAAAVVDGAIAAGGGAETWLDPEETTAVLAAYGIDVIRSVDVRSAAEAAAAATSLGTPVALKVTSPSILHKSDVGGVVLGIETPDEASTVYDDLTGRLGDAMTGAIVQPMASEGVEVIVGLLQDPTFGPVMMFGTGGTTAELWADRAHALVPVTEQRAAQLVGEPRGAALLHGYRGAAPADLAALEELVLRVSTLGEQLPGIAELDLNPVIAGPDGYAVVDARCRVAEPPSRDEPNVRRLRTGG
ncbi:MAG: GNAT family N-acetyltransferase [Acidimicrobiia bacterium]|nr:GNAT family N-acetyltransferase [Acidimicrobiia bacterium]